MAQSSEAHLRVARWAVITVLLALLVVSGLVALLWVVATKEHPAPVIAVDREGRVFEAVPVHQPIATDAQIINWAAARFGDFHTFGFLTWEEQLNELEPYFLKRQWPSFKRATSASTVIKTVRERNLMTTVRLVEGPEITGTRITSDGHYLWRVEAKMVRLFRGGDNETTQDRLHAVMLVQRVPRSVSPEGIQVKGYVVKPIRG